MNKLAFALTLLLAAKSFAAASSTAQKMDTLGGNEALVNMATSMDPENRARIVQKRLVDRNKTFEIGLNYGGVAGGDTYLKTSTAGASVDFHINPRWSLGVRYYDYGSELTAEGKRVFEDAKKKRAKNETYEVPDIDYPLNSTMGVLTWYPVYGKTNLLDWGISQFDIYLLAGAGTIELSSGNTETGMAGAGVGFWITKHISARAEIRYQGYKDNLGARDIQTTSGSFGMGFLL